MSVSPAFVYRLTGRGFIAAGRTVHAQIFAASASDEFVNSGQNGARISR
jgi:hypothetical protein